MRLEATDCWRGKAVELFVLEPDGVTEEYVAWLNDPLVNRYLESRFVQADMQSTRRFVEDALASPVTILFGIRSLGESRHVGNIKLGPIDRPHGRGEIGIMIGDRGAWGRGFATDAIECVVAIARMQLGLRKLTAGCYASNVGSLRAFTKAGFEIEGRRKAHYLLNGEPEDLILMARFI